MLRKERNEARSFGTHSLEILGGQGTGKHARMEEGVV